MNAERLSLKEEEQFINYCKKHRSKLDDSYISDEELSVFKPGEENPTYTVKENDEIIAVASLIRDNYHRSIQKGRFRIFYSEKQDKEIYSVLLTSILKHVQELRQLFIFVPYTNRMLSESMKQLSFVADRYVFIMTRNTEHIAPTELEEEYSIKTLETVHDEEDWCRIRNAAFRNLKGNNSPLTTEVFREQLSSRENLEGGCLLLIHKDKPIGIIRGTDDVFEGKSVMNIGPFAVMPAYQGKKLGTQLLRAALRFAKKMGYQKIILSVNAENERAKELYLKEGFVQAEGFISYVRDIS